MKINKINIFNIQNQNSSQKTAFGVIQTNSQSKNDKKNTTKNVAIAVSALGAVGLATFFILSRKPQNVKTTINELEQVVEQQVSKPKVVLTTPKIPQYSQELLGEASTEINSHLGFLKRNPKGFYLEYGKEINNFLRKGELKDVPQIADDFPAFLRSIVEKKVLDTKNLNRAIVESIETLDSMMTSKTKAPMSVYRDAPASWIRTAKDGIIKDDAFLSTSTVPGASMEGLIGSKAHLNKRYEIRLPKDFPFLDLTYTSEKEILLPRGLSFRAIADDIFEVIV